MKQIILLTIIFSLFTAESVNAANNVKIISLFGDVKVRYGLEENWNNAQKGMSLKEVDTILSGEGAEIVLQTTEGETFKLGGNSILDITDLRKIVEKELFLILMSKKIEQIEHKKEKTKFRIGNVSVVHGESKDTTNSKDGDSTQSNWFVREVNGAVALFTQKYFPNTIIKLNKILSKYSPVKDCGKIYYYIGKSFEAINKPGQAVDAYKKSIEWCKEQNCEGVKYHDRILLTEQAIKKLQSQIISN